MFEISVSAWFAAAHQLRLGDRLEPLHGHNWQVVVTYRGAGLTHEDLLVDFVALRERLNAVLAELHDRNLNDLAAFAARNPSAEAVAEYLAARLAPDEAGPVRLSSVAVEEAPGCIARYFPPSSAALRGAAPRDDL
jgi:6-pyruvoyl-tetrahydropterin synthase